MTFKSIEEFLNYIEKAYSAPTEERTGEVESGESPFDNNTKALNVLFRNAMNGRDFHTAFGIIAYANAQQITLTKGR